QQQKSPPSPPSSPQPLPQPLPQQREQEKQKEQTSAKGDVRREYCQKRNCLETPTYSEDGERPAVRCRDHRKDDMFRVQNDVKFCGVDGCASVSEVNYMDQGGRIRRYCAEHREPAIVLEQAEYCEHGECDGSPRYGPQEGPLSFCQAHKRVGMCTARDGVLYVATRDGSAFRKEVVPAVSGDTGGATAAGAAAVAVAVAATAAAASPEIAGDVDTVPSLTPPSKPAEQPSPASSTPSSPPVEGVKGVDNTTVKLVPGKNGMMSRKLCEVPGCMVQPSYGEPGTGKPRFCTGHKKKGHISLKNRPCIFPGCTTRPHYGPSKGRPVFCATHKQDDHVHLLKEAEGLEKRRLQRKRRRSSGGSAASGKDKQKKKRKKKTTDKKQTKAKGNEGEGEEEDRMSEAKKTKKVKVEASARTPAQGKEGEEEKVEDTDEGKEEKRSKGKGPARGRKGSSGAKRAVVVAGKKAVAAVVKKAGAFAGKKAGLAGKASTISEKKASAAAPTKKQQKQQ
ncbi:unnamed protein product, partial [Scytosiphon promiscuus]